MAAIGSALKEARAKKSISLEDVHSRIKIHPRVLQLLEEEKFEKLPSPLFAKSFLKSYAEFLELNADELLAHYEKVAQKDPEQVLFIKPAHEAKRTAPAVDARVVVVGVSVLAAALLIAALVFSFSWLRAHWPAAKPKAAVTRPVKAAAKPAPAPAEAKKKVDWLRSVEQGNYPEISAKTPLMLHIKALNDVWIRASVDGKTVYQSILKRGTSQSLQAKDKIEIWTGNSSSMYLTLNSYAIGSPGKGVVKRMLITREGVRIAK